MSHSSQQGVRGGRQVAHREQSLHAEPGFDQKGLERPRREVPDVAGLSRPVVHEEELLPPDPLEEVPPIGEVRRREDQNPVGSKDAPAVREETRGVQQVLDDFSGEDDIEPLRIPWEALGDVVPNVLDLRRHFLRGERVDPAPPDRGWNPSQEIAPPAADVQDRRRTFAHDQGKRGLEPRAGGDVMRWSCVEGGVLVVNGASHAARFTHFSSSLVEDLGTQMSGPWLRDDCPAGRAGRPAAVRQRNSNHQARTCGGHSRMDVRRKGRASSQRLFSARAYPNQLWASATERRAGGPAAAISWGKSRHIFTSAR